MNHKRDVFSALEINQGYLERERHKHYINLNWYGGKFQNMDLKNYCNENVIKHTFSTPWTL